MVGIGTSDVNLDKYRHTFCSLLGKDEDSWGLSYTGNAGRGSGSAPPTAKQEVELGRLINMQKPFSTHFGTQCFVEWE